MGSVLCCIVGPVSAAMLVSPFPPLNVHRPPVRCKLSGALCATIGVGMTGLEERIIAFTADEIGVKREEVRFDSTLLHDLAMDGHDAVEFFEKFGTEFNVDL